MRKKIWVVEDDIDIAEIIKLILSDESRDISIFYDASSFRKAKRAIDADLLIMDVMLPDGNGIELCQELRGECQLSLPILMMSANTAISSVQRVCKVNDFIAKPFDIDDFAQRIDKLLH